MATARTKLSEATRQMLMLPPLPRAHFVGRVVHRPEDFVEAMRASPFFDKPPAEVHGAVLRDLGRMARRVG